VRAAARLALALWLLIGGLGVAQAQFAPDFDKATAETAFPEASRFHNRDLGDLFKTRGLSAPAMKAISVAEAAAFLERKDAAAPYPPGTSILFYDQRDGELRAWLIGREGLLAASRQPVTPVALAQAIRNLRLSLNVDGIDVSRAPAPRAAVDERLETRNWLDADLGALSTVLLPKPIVAGLKATKHLVIVANGAIGTVPHAMLLLDRKTALIDRMTVSVSPGLYDLDQMIRAWDAKAALADPLIVGDPLLKPHPNWRVAQLDGAAEEAGRFATLIGAQALTAAAARKDAIVGRMRTASLLYFAAHGVSNPANPLRGGFLMLSGDTADQGFLTAGEVQAMRPLRAQLVVLSACQSGLGMVHDGGVIGLTRSFQKAGAARVVMSLWSVDDAATLTLMTHFQKQLLKQPPAVALRLAMLETRKSFPEPRFWAPFLLFGTPR
jgi:hypothetical protein